MSTSEGKHYYCSISAEFGRVMPDGTKVPKNPTGSTWLDLEYGEAVAFQAMVLAPAVKSITKDSLCMGIKKAEADGAINAQTAQMLLEAVAKEEDVNTGRRR